MRSIWFFNQTREPGLVAAASGACSYSKFSFSFAESFLKACFVMPCCSRTERIFLLTLGPLYFLFFLAFLGVAPAVAPAVASSSSNSSSSSDWCWFVALRLPHGHGLCHCHPPSLVPLPSNS